LKDLIDIQTNLINFLEDNLDLIYDTCAEIYYNQEYENEE